MFMPGSPTLREIMTLRKWGRILALLACVALCEVAATAQTSDSDDPVDRHFAFIDRSNEAIRLFNEGKTSEALAAFQDLAFGFADLDVNGFAALSVGDCLAILHREQEARWAYENVQISHPDLAETVRDRLIELELTGQVTDALIEQLRLQASEEGPSPGVLQWQLARALQRRSHDLLIEAVAAFRQANAAAPGRQRLEEYAATLETVAQDLAALIDQRQRLWGTIRKPLSLADAKPCAGAPDVRTEKYSAEWSVLTKDGTRLEFRMAFDERKPGVGVTVGGKPVELTPAQLQAIHRHRDRIHTILTEAVQAARAAAEGERK